MNGQSNKITDKEVAAVLVAQNGEELKNVSDELRNDRDIVFLAVGNSPYALQYAGEKMRHDVNLIFTAIGQLECCSSWAEVIGDKPHHYWFQEIVGSNLYNDKSFILKVLNRQPYLYLEMNPELKRDRDIINIALRNRGRNIYHIPPDACNDSDFPNLILCAVESYPPAIKLAPTELLFDREFVISALKANADCMSYIIPFMKVFADDAEVAKYAAASDDFTLKCAPRNIKCDKEIASIVLRRSAIEAKYISKSLRENKEFMLESIKENPEIYHYLCKALKGDKDISTVISEIRASGMHHCRCC